MNEVVLLAAYCGVIIAVSLAGGRLSSLLRMTHLRTQLLMSAVGGLMLGIAMLHMLPHATDVLGSSGKAGMGSLIGLTVMFLIVRLFHSHDHGDPPLEPTETDALTSATHRGAVTSVPHDGCGHPHSDHDHRASERGVSWFGLFFGLLLHTLVDGIALSSSVIAEMDHGAWLGLGGLGTFLAVALHKPLDAFAITSVMSRQSWSAGAQWIANVVFSLACPGGAFAFYFGVGGIVGSSEFLGWGLALSAGFFIGIALADLLPEVAFHDHDRGKLTLAFLVGIAVAIGVENLPGHSHEHSAPPHAHTGHDHAESDPGNDGHDHGHSHD
ncbi:MAG: ZIP family metal transporter [Planctomycetota bacterium]